MSLGVSGCFGSCLSTTKSFFASPKNHISSAFNRTAFADKIFKTADPVLHAAHEIARSAGAEKETLEGLQKGREWAKTTRDGTALLNIFNGVVAALVEQGKAFFRLLGNFVSSKEERARAVPLKDPESHKYNEWAVGNKEKVAATFAYFGKAVGSATFIFGFGVCRPIQNVEKHIYKPIKKEIDPIAHDLGDSFGAVMTINHIGAWIGHLGEMVYQDLAFHRLCNEEIVSNEVFQARYDVYYHKMKENTIAITEKSLELMSDVALHVARAAPAYAAPAWFTIPVNLGIGCLGIWKEWIKTA